MVYSAAPDVGLDLFAQACMSYIFGKYDMHLYHDEEKF